MSRIRFFSSILFVLIILTGMVYPAQDSPITPDRIRSTYRHLDYRKTIELGEQYLEEHPRIVRETLLEILQYIAFSQVALGRDEQAKSTMRSILITDPDYTLDENLASPKVKRLFSELQEEMASGHPQPERSPSLVILEDVKTSATLKSVIFPGAGQRYLGQTRGYLYGGVAGISLGLFIYSAFRVPSARKDYLRTTNPEKIPSEYDTYNRWYHYRNNSLIAYASVWSLSLIDVLVFGPSTEPVISLQPSHSGVQLAFSFQW